jgi:orotate phosphoribosyltransferase
VVEDVITSGASALHAIEAILAEGGTVAGVLAVVNREEGGAEMIEAGGYQVVSLTTTSKLGLDQGS